jgi:outer membrane protein
LSLYGSFSTSYSSTTFRPEGGPVDLGYLPTGAITQSGEPVLAPRTFQQYGRTPFPNQINDNIGKTLGINLSVPIFSGFSAHNSVNRARLNLKNSEVYAQQTKNTVYKSIQQAYNDAISSQKKYGATSKSLESYQEAYTYADKKFNAGLSSSLEFLTATNNLTKAKTDQLQAKYDFIFKIKILDFYAGNPLTF